MDLKRLLLPIVPLLVVSGCAGMTREEAREFQLLSDRVLLNQAQGEEVLSRLDELETKLELLRAKIAPDDNERADGASVPPASSGSMNEPAGATDDNAAFTAPEGLKVVSLSTPGVAAAAAAPKKAAGANASERRRPDPVAATPAVDKPDRRAAVTASLSEKDGPGEEAAPEELYRRGREEYTSGRYAAARGLFFSLDKAYPGHSLADNALYWVGETYYSEKDYGRALEIFTWTADKYPEGNKAPDSLLKAGLSSAELADRDGAVAALELLIRRYPGTTPAQKAVGVMASIDDIVESARQRQSAQR